MDTERDIELRVVVRSMMTDSEAEAFAEEIKAEVQDHLLSGEEVVLSVLATDKISYESKQLLKELGVQ